MNFALTLVSGNAKTGAIPVSVSSRETCPTTCPFFNKGCYAKTGRTAIQWRKVTNGERGTNFDEFVTAIRSIARGSLWRHNVSGDLPHQNGNIIASMMKKLISANRGRKGFTYTHHALNEHNVALIQEANRKGFTINASTESVEVADEVMTKHAIPAVAVVNSDEKRRFFTTSSGRKVVVCPATIHDKVNCATCGLCQKADRSFIIAFPAHGTAKKTVNEIVS